MKRWVIIFSIITCFSFVFHGCEWLGRTAAKTEKAMKKGAKKVERGIESMEKSIQEGYNKEKQEK